MRYAPGWHSRNRKLLIVTQLFYCKDFSNESAKCVVFDLRLFLGTRWYHTRKVRLTVCCQHDRALASDIPLWPLQPPCLLTIRRTEFLLSMHKDKCMSHSWMYQLYNDRGWDTLFLLDLYVWGKPSACTFTQLDDAQIKFCWIQYCSLKFPFFGPSWC